MDNGGFKKRMVPVWVPIMNFPRWFATRTKFAEEFPCKHGTSFLQICEPDSVQQVARSRAEWMMADSKKERYPWGTFLFLEAPPRFGLGIEVLQTFALPLGHGAIFC